MENGWLATDGVAPVVALQAGGDSARLSLCPEREFRDSLSEGDFWNYVLRGIRPGEHEFEYEPDDQQYFAERCMLCEHVIEYDEYEGMAMWLEAGLAICDDCVQERNPLLDGDEGFEVGMREVGFTTFSPWEQAFLYEQYLDRAA